MSLRDIASRGVVLFPRTIHRRVVWFNFILSHFWKQKNPFIVSPFGPDTFLLSNLEPARRRNTRCLAYYGIGVPFGSGEDESPPSAANAEDFRAHARPQPPFTPACPISLAQCKAVASAISRRGRTSGAVRTVEVGPWPKLLSNRRRRREIVFFTAEGRYGPYQASRRCSQRRPVSGFEPGAVFGTMVETIKKLFQNYRCSTVCVSSKRVTDASDPTAFGRLFHARRVKWGEVKVPYYKPRTGGPFATRRELIALAFAVLAFTIVAIEMYFDRFSP